MTEQFTAALIGAPFGLKGFVKARPLSGETAHLLALQSVTIRPAGTERALRTERVLRIEEAVSQPPVLLIKFAGFDSPEAAKALCGAELLVDREHACPLRPGEFYVEDLRGLAVMDAESGELIGHIAGIDEGGGGELAGIRLADGQIKLVPFRREFFAEISPEQGRILLRNRWILE